MSVTRDPRLAEALVELADTLVADFDVVEFLHVLAQHCVELLGAGAVGLMLADQHGQLRVMASSDERARLLELFELQTDEGPCVVCYRTGLRAADPDLRSADPRWARFAERASAAGFASIQALPLRLRDETIGVLNLFRVESGELGQDELRIGQALADVATIGLLQERAIHHRQVLAEQLQGALSSRVLIEQAKGVLAERLRVDMDGAFRILREHARRRNLRLSDAAGGLIDGSISTDEFASARGGPQSP